MIGRKREIEELENLYNSNDAQLVAIYGRRRVGKTYLINYVFEEKFTFKHAGLSPDEDNKAESLIKQLHHFYNSLTKYGMSKEEKEPKNWFDAFLLLEKLLETKDKKEKWSFLSMNYLGWTLKRVISLKLLKDFGMDMDVAKTIY